MQSDLRNRKQANPKTENAVPPTPPEPQEDLLSHIEHLLSSLETKITHFEEQSAALLDGKIEHCQLLFSRLQTKGKTRALQFVQGLEDLVGEKGHDQLKAAVTFCEETLHALEESHMAQSVQAALTSAKTRLLTIDELPLPWQENPYIKCGYRFCQHPSQCVASALHLHNETCNIWTHFGGFLYVLYLACVDLPATQMWALSSLVDRIPMLIFVVAALKCLICSAAYHTFTAIAHWDTRERFGCVDYSAITVLIVSSILAAQYSMLYCHFYTRTAYMALSLVSGAAGVVFTWSPNFNNRAYRTKRVAFFVGLAVSGGVSALHAALYSGTQAVGTLFWPLVKSLLCYTVGLVFYALYIPERLRPGGVFDYVCMSHNLWHVAVFGGIYFHYKALLIDFERNLMQVC